MIPFPSKKYFRIQLIFGLVIYVLYLVVGYTSYDLRDQIGFDMVALNFYGSIIDIETAYLLYDFVTVVNFCGVLGMILFQGWGRFLILGGLLVNFVITPFCGMVVITGTMDMLWILTEVLVGVPWVLSFFEPCSQYFIKEEPKLILEG